MGRKNTIQKTIWISEVENNKWDPKSIHLILKYGLTYSDLEKIMKVYTKLKQKNLEVLSD